MRVAPPAPVEDGVKRLKWRRLCLTLKAISVGLLVVVVAAITPHAGRAEAQPDARERFVCTFRGTPRYIDIYRLAARGPRGAGCRVNYTRNGVTRQVWAASGDYAYCVKRAVGLVTKLSKGNFSCKPETAESSGP